VTETSPWYRDGDQMLVACEGGPNSSRLVHYPPPLEIDIGHLGVYVLHDRGTPEQPEYVYVYIAERM
jgi:hypothetical protein